MTKDGENRRTLAFYGEIAELQIDVVKKWVELEFTYELPPAKGLPEELAGRPAARPPKISDFYPECSAFIFSGLLSPGSGRPSRGRRARGV